MNKVITLTPTCKCGQPMEFAPNQTISRCPVKGCGMRWERGSEGYWATGLFTTAFTPIFTEEVKKPKTNRYEKYMEWRNKRKAGRK